MKHIVNFITIILFIFCTSLFCQCRGRAPYAPQLMQIDSMLNEADVDTAKVLAAFRRVSKSLDSLDTDNRMYYNLLTQYYMFKTYQPVENDSILKIVLEYYGDKPTKEGLLANYIATGMYSDREEYENAQDCGLRFLRMTDKTSDFDKVMRAKCHLELQGIYLNHLDSLMVLEQSKQAVYWAEQTTDTMLMADSYYYLSNMYEACKNYKQSLQACNKAYEFYSMAGYTNGAARMWVMRAKNHMALNDLSYAKLCMKNYEAMTSDLDSFHRIKPGLNNEIYYDVMGRLYEKSGNTDSAFMYYYLEFASPNEVYHRSGSGYLAKLYDKMGESDSARKYYHINLQSQQKSISTYSDKKMQGKQIEYDLEVLNEKSISIEYRLAVIFFIMSLSVIPVYKKRLWIKNLFLLLRDRHNESLADKAKGAEQNETEIHENSDDYIGKPLFVDREECHSKGTVYSASLKNDSEESEKLLSQKNNENPFLTLLGEYGSPVDYSSFSMVMNLRAMFENDEGISLKGSSWCEIETYVKKEDPAFAAFMVCLVENCKRITPKHIHICILIRAGFQPKEVSILMNMSQSATTNLRRNLAAKILRNPQSRGEDLDAYIRCL